MEMMVWFQFIFLMMNHFLFDGVSGIKFQPRDKLLWLCEVLCLYSLKHGIIENELQISLVEIITELALSNFSLWEYSLTTKWEKTVFSI